LLVRNDSAGLTVGKTPTDRLHDVNVVQHVVQAAVVGQPIEQRAYRVFGGHNSLMKEGCVEYTTDASPSQVLKPTVFILRFDVSLSRLTCALTRGRS